MRGCLFLAKEDTPGNPLRDAAEANDPGPPTGIVGGARVHELLQERGPEERPRPAEAGDGAPWVLSCCGLRRRDQVAAGSALAVDRELFSRRDDRRGLLPTPHRGGQREEVTPTSRQGLPSWRPDPLLQKRSPEPFAAGIWGTMACPSSMPSHLSSIGTPSTRMSSSRLGGSGRIRII